MKTGKATRKVKSGKLVQVEVSYDDTHIKDVKITGDFFLHPEDVVLLLESCLCNEVISQRKAVGEKLEHVLVDNNAQLIGCSCLDILDIVYEAMEK